MIGKKDNHDIFNQYTQVILEQAENNEFLSLINKIKACSLDQASKDKVIEMIKAQMEHGIGDADAAGYASYPDAKPAIDQDDQDTVNDDDRDDNWANEMRKAQEDQNKKYPEKEEEEEEPMPTEAPWWIPGEDAKERWLATRQGHWRQAQREKKQGSNKTT